MVIRADGRGRLRPGWGGRVEAIGLYQNLLFREIHQQHSVVVAEVFHVVQFDHVVPVGQYHVDTMAVLPEGAVLLASSADCAHQAYRLGERAWALQFHPEIDAEIMASWIDDDPEPVAARGFDRDRIVAEFRVREPELVEAWRPFARAFVDVVRASAAR